MPAKSPPPILTVAERLRALGSQVRQRRKTLGVSAVSTAKAAGMSRVTLYRIEKGEPSVSAGAYANALAALGLELVARLETDAADRRTADREGWIPARILLADYPQLQQLAWQIHGTDNLSPIEARDIYVRNWRHVDESAMIPAERQLVAALRAAFGT